MRKSEKRVVRIDGHAITLTSEEEILFPKAGFTKGDLIEYYTQVAPYILPYLKNRPVTLHRFPEGVGKDGFYQKQISSYFPSWIKRTLIKNRTEGATQYVVCNDVASLIYLTNQRTITYHPWLSTISKKNYPDRMIFDLDPSPGVSFASIRFLAEKMKEFLNSLGFPTYAMLTGSRGVHVVVPLKPTHTYERVHACAHDIAEYMSMVYPEKATIQVRKNKRGKRIFVDYLRNTYGATAVAPYSVRANEKAGVATPVHWEELFKSTSNPQQYTMKNILKRLSHVKDPWQDMQKSAVTITQAHKKVRELLEDTQLTL